MFYTHRRPDGLADGSPSLPEEFCLYLMIVERAFRDLWHDREEIRDDALEFLFDPQDSRLKNTLGPLGINPDYARRALHNRYRDCIENGLPVEFDLDNVIKDPTPEDEQMILDLLDIVDMD